MGDLEESMFKRNIPGKYSRWAEEGDDFRRGNNEDEEDNDNEANEPQDPVYSLVTSSDWFFINSF
jgi:hypothetical protein